MIKRPLHPQFNKAVIHGWKSTTIRDRAWPVGLPIKFYNWSGRPYNSPQEDVAAVLIVASTQIQITNTEGLMSYSCAPDFNLGSRDLYQTEGFKHQDAMDDWFRQVVKPGKTVTKYLMSFRRNPFRFAQGICNGQPFKIRVAEQETISQLKKHFLSTVGHDRIEVDRWFWDVEP